MASISKQPNGRRTIQFVAPNGKRKSIRLGKTSQRDAEAIKTTIEALVASAASGFAWDNETARWVAGIEDVLAGKLARAGLIPKRQAAVLSDFLDSYFAKRADVKDATRTNWGHTRPNRFDFFGRDKPLRDITPGDADDWRLYMMTQVPSENTVNKRCGNAKQFFKHAVRHKLIEANPFADLKSTVRGNPKRFYFITLDEAYKVLDQCPDAQWRLLFALSRFGGLRCPSEHLLLRWTDIDWGCGRITITSLKTEHHPDGESRVIPIFPELLPYLEECFEMAEPGAEFVISLYRRTETNLRTQLHKIIHRAGMKPWPKVFQNLRSTRQTELEERFPSHVVCAWVGNSERVAREHYLQVTDRHYESTLQKAVQQPAARSCTGSQRESETRENSGNCETMRKEATRCVDTEPHKMGVHGFEPWTSSLSATRSNQLSYTPVSNFLGGTCYFRPGSSAVKWAEYPTRGGRKPSIFRLTILFWCRTFTCQGRLIVAIVSSRQSYPF